MAETPSFLLVLLGLSTISGASALLVSCLRLKSLLDFTLATYVTAWACIVGASLALSPTGSLTRRSALIVCFALLVVALTVWSLRGRPRPPAAGPTFAVVRTALDDPLLRVLTAVVVLAFGYSVLLALLTPINDGDALAYHLARAAFWHQEGGVGYVEGAVDSRLNGNPPNAEIGMLFTMLLAGSDRYVALPQLAAYVGLVVCVAGLGRRAGLDPRASIFGALLFASLPIVVVQASTGLNDLVVAAFLAVATYFVLSPGRASLLVIALALALAFGTKVTAVLAIPLILAVVLLGRPRRDWPEVAAAGATGTVLGSAWYLVNVLEAGSLDGGLVDDDSGQRAETSPAAILVTLLRLFLDVVDLSGTPGPFALTYLAIGVAMLLVAIVLHDQHRRSVSLAVGGIVVASALLVYPVFDLSQEFVFRSWAALGRPPTPDFEFGWGLNVVADPGLSWYGPLGVLLFAGVLGAILLRRRRTAPPLIVLFALAPLVSLAALATLVVWDSVRGRLVIFGVALAASTWGLMLRARGLAAGAVAIAAIATTASLLNYQGKPSGIGALLGVQNPFDVSVQSVWGASRAEVQTRTRPGTPEHDVIRFVDESIQAGAGVAVAPNRNDFLSPYFGSHLAREVSLLLDGASPPASAEWLVVSQGLRVVRCPGSWRAELELDSGWRVERRRAPDSCLGER